jgi:type VI secretion system secreted protein VgrG
MSTPSSAGLVAGGGVQFAAQGDISAVAGKNADWSVMKRWTVAAGEMISLFARNGLKIFAAKGPVEFHAQSGPMSFIADKDVNLASVNGKVNLAAAKEITLECGGAFIHMKDGSITLGGPGDLFLKTITIQKKAKASMNTPMPAHLPRRLAGRGMQLCGVDQWPLAAGHARRRRLYAPEWRACWHGCEGSLSR